MYVDYYLKIKKSKRSVNLKVELNLFKNVGNPTQTFYAENNRLKS